MLTAEREKSKRNHFDVVVVVVVVVVVFGEGSRWLQLLPQGRETDKLLVGMEEPLSPHRRRGRS